jgi:class 3 adenylate cyclase
MSATPRINETVLRNRLAELSEARDWQLDTLTALERFVRTADDYELFRVNPVQYAAATELAVDDAISLFLHAAKIGLFEMDWLVLCEYCPQVAGSFRELDQVHPRFNCDFCNANNDVALDDYIQVAFTVSAQVRDIAFHHPDTLSVADYYLRYNFAKGFIPPGGMTPEQIVALLSREFADIEPGERRRFEFDVTLGRFEILDLAHGQLLVFFCDGEAAPAQDSVVRLDNGRLVAPGHNIGPRDMSLGDGSFSFRQAGDLRPGPHLIEIENLMDERGRFWVVQYPADFVPHHVAYEPFLSGKRLLLSSTFADLYRGQLVNEGEGLTVSDLTFLFTDLKASTPLYDSVGDMNAYFMVRQHFEILNDAIQAHSGLIVKTIGDAIMAVFERPADAVAAGVAMIEGIERYNRTVSRPLGLKVGLHRGRAIAVTLNERIDYFGQDVNIAARVQDLAEAGEICLTDDTVTATGVSHLLTARTVFRTDVQLRGVGQTVGVHRIKVA